MFSLYLIRIDFLESSPYLFFTLLDFFLDSMLSSVDQYLSSESARVIDNPMRARHQYSSLNFRCFPEFQKGDEKKTFS